jgi:hypothetical protein
MQRSWIRDLLLLTALCWGVYCLGLTTHGLTNWQEAQRALVAREMQGRGEWIVPTVDGRPYLAKPPLIYWCQLAIAKVRGATTGEFELRMTVAMAGWLGCAGDVRGWPPDARGECRMVGWAPAGDRSALRAVEPDRRTRHTACASDRGGGRRDSRGMAPAPCRRKDGPAGRGGCHRRGLRRDAGERATGNPDDRICGV